MTMVRIMNKRISNLLVVLVALVVSVWIHQATCGGNSQDPGVDDATTESDTTTENVTTTESDTTTEAPSFPATSGLPFNPHDESGWTRSWIKNIIIFGVVVCVLVGGFFVVRYLRTERKQSFIRRYSRLKTSSRVGQDVEGDDEDIELSIFEKK